LFSAIISPVAMPSLRSMSALFPAAVYPKDFIGLCQCHAFYPKIQYGLIRCFPFVKLLQQFIYYLSRLYIIFFLNYSIFLLFFKNQLLNNDAKNQTIFYFYPQKKFKNIKLALLQFYPVLSVIYRILVRQSLTRFF
jgi:hypothetical protein